MSVPAVPTALHMHWTGHTAACAPAITLDVSLSARPMTSDELHHVAEVVAVIEEMRGRVTGDVLEEELP
jgi:1,2-phenylacetyl-CoA epoxidase catalytic subunit